MAVKDPHILLTGNSRKIQRVFAGLLDQAAQSAVEAEIHRNIRGMYKLGVAHHAFAMTKAKGDWRQSVSRHYYACYNTWRCVQYATLGSWSTETSEHKKVDSLPSKFPNKAKYELSLPKLREDRNIADYDHEATVADLLIGVSATEVLSTEFLSDTKLFMKDEHGIVL